MKVSDRKGDQKTNKELTADQKRAIEQELGVSLKKPTPDQAYMLRNQQFMVHDEDKVYAGRVMSDGEFFSRDEIISKVTNLFK